jgi:hypothetical protein
VEEVDLSSQHVGEACSAFVDVVMATYAAKQFGPRLRCDSELLLATFMTDAHARDGTIRTRDLTHPTKRNMKTQLIALESRCRQDQNRATGGIEK